MKKNVFIIRNAEYKYNASMQRVYAALNDHYIMHIIERSRQKSDESIIKNKNKYLIEVKSEIGGGISNLTNLLIYQIKLIKILYACRNTIDYIHAFDFDTGLVSTIFAKVFKKKIVYHIADFYADSRNFPNFLSNVIRKLEYKVINNADTTIICTEERVKQIVGSNPKKLEVVHNIPLFNKKYETSKHKNNELNNFCYIGTLSENRFIIELLEFFKENPTLNLVIGGYGKLNDYVKCFSDELSNIDYIGKVEYEETYNHYNSTDYIIAMYNPKVNNHKYSAPNKFYESYILGKPIIVARETGIDDYVNKYNTGFICDYNYNAFSKLVKSINRKDYEKKLKSFQEEHFTKDNMLNKIREIYENIKVDM